jgi:hypothetical protein
MSQRTDAAEARAWKKRWEVVNSMEIEELQQTSMEVKMRQLGSMMALARELGWAERMAEGEADVRERWNRLRRAFRG